MTNRLEIWNIIKGKKKSRRVFSFYCEILKDKKMAQTAQQQQLQLHQEELQLQQQQQEQYQQVQQDQILEKRLGLGVPLECARQLISENLSSGIKYRKEAEVTLCSFFNDLIYDILEMSIHVKQNLPPMECIGAPSEGEDKKNDKMICSNDVGRALIIDKSLHTRIVVKNEKASRLLKFLKDPSTVPTSKSTSEMEAETSEGPVRRGESRQSKTMAQYGIRDEIQSMKEEEDEEDDENYEEEEDEDEEDEEEEDDEED